MLTDIEMSRRADFAACPILEDYIACMLQDLQYTEADEACTDGHEERDTGSIYTLPDAAYQACRAEVQAFADTFGDDIAAAVELVPGERGLRSARGRYMTHERIGSTLWLARSGSGVGFTDDGDAECLQRLDAGAREMPHVDPYIGDDGLVYLS